MQKRVVKLEGRPRRLVNGRRHLRTVVYRTAAIFASLYLVTPVSRAMSATCNPSISILLHTVRGAEDAFTILVLPDLGPIKPSDVDIGGHGRKISLLLKRRGNLNNLLAAFNQHRDRTKPVLTNQGLTSFSGTDTGPFAQSETYFASEGDVVTDVLQCGPQDSSLPSPGCNHWISYGAYLVQAEYGRGWLPKWHDIRNTVTAAFDQCGVP